MKTEIRKILILLLIMTGCTLKCEKDRKDMTPEEIVESYLEIAFNISKVEQKTLLMEYTTGELKAAISSATDETIRKAYIEPKYELNRFSIVERRDRTPREVEITYLIVYRDLPKGSISLSQSAVIETENRVSLVKEKKFWYIREVLGNATTIEFPLEKITPHR